MNAYLLTALIFIVLAIHEYGPDVMDALREDYEE